MRAECSPIKVRRPVGKFNLTNMTSCRFNLWSFLGALGKANLDFTGFGFVGVAIKICHNSRFHLWMKNVTIDSVQESQGDIWSVQLRGGTWEMKWTSFKCLI